MARDGSQAVDCIERFAVTLRKQGVFAICRVRRFRAWDAQQIAQRSGVMFKRRKGELRGKAFERMGAEVGVAGVCCL